MCSDRSKSHKMGLNLCLGCPGSLLLVIARTECNCGTAYLGLGFEDFAYLFTRKAESKQHKVYQVGSLSHHD